MSFKFVILAFAFNYYELMIYDRLQMLHEAILVIVLLILKSSQISLVKSLYWYSLTTLYKKFLTFKFNYLFIYLLLLLVPESLSMVSEWRCS